MEKLCILGGILGALTQCQTHDTLSRVARGSSDVTGDVIDRLNETVRSMESLLEELSDLDQKSIQDLRNSLPDTDVYATSKLKHMSNIIQNLSYCAGAEFPDLTSHAVSMLSRVGDLGYLIGTDMRLDESRRLTFPWITIYVSRVDVERFRGLYFSTDDGSDLMAIPHLVTFPADTADVISVWYSISGVSAILRGLSNSSLASDLLAVTFYDVNGTKLKATLEEHIFISIKVKPAPEGKRPTCAYLKNSQWATDGCDTVYPARYDNNRAECRCYHLTVFGIIFVDQPYIPRIGVAAMIGSGFTIFFCLITVLVFIGYRLMHSIRCYIRFSFLTALALAEIMYLCIRYTEAPAMCTTIAAGAHFFTMASFTWLLSYALFLGNEMIGDDDTSLHITHYTFLGWAVPLAVVLISFIWRYDSYVHDQYCWISDRHGLPYAFVLPICFIIVTTLSVLVYDIAVYSKVKLPTKTTTLKVTRSGLRSCCCVLPVLSTVWLMAHFMVNIGYLTLQIIFSLLNIVLGVMLFLIMFWFNEEVAMKLNNNGVTMKRLWPKKRKCEEDPPHKGTMRTMEMTLITEGFSPKAGSSGRTRKLHLPPSPRYERDSDETEAQDSPYLKVTRPAPIASSEDSLLTKDSDEGGNDEVESPIGHTDVGVSSTVSLLPESRS